LAVTDSACVPTHLDLRGSRSAALDEFGQQSPDRHGIAHRQLRAAALGDLQPI
jgi:hypothetical protein